MKVILFVCALLFVASCDMLVQNDYLINKINNNPKATWKAGKNKVFEGKTLSEIKHMLGTFLVIPETDQTPKVSFGIQPSELPKEFDSYKNWPACVHPIRNQAQCGSCWAFSAAETLTDRQCIASQGRVNVVLSPQDMVSCDKTDYGCQGGYLNNAWRYLEQHGIVSDKCLPYKSGSGHVPACPSRCDSSSVQWKKYKAKSGSTKHFADVASAQADIAAHGPIQAGFSVYQDFFSYKSGVYQHVSGGLAGGHAIKINGWGVDSASGLPYWIVANSWGPSWGMKGYFWIRRGNNECNIESQLYAGRANV